MNPQEITALFGYSEFSPEMKQAFAYLHMPLQQPDMSVCWRNYLSEKWDMELVFRAKNNFYLDYGPFKQAYTDSYDEAFLEEINFGNQKGNTNYPFPLPFNLTFHDKPETVKGKMKIKSSKTFDASYGRYFKSNTEDFQFVTGFDREDRLIWINVKLLELSFKRKRDLTKSIKRQNKNINPLHSKHLAELKGQYPTENWKNRMSEGDKIFNERNIQDTDYVLNDFIDHLIAATEQKKASAIYAATKKFVLGMNKFNDQHQSFVDTMEREELVEYVHKAIRLTGFKIDDNIDLTEEWREW
jgi:hypothetical protein